MRVDEGVADQPVCGRARLFCGLVCETRKDTIHALVNKFYSLAVAMTHAWTTSATSSSYRTRTFRCKMSMSLFIGSIRARLISASEAVARFGRVELDGDVDGEGTDELE